MSNTDPWIDSIHELSDELGLSADESVAAIRHEAASFDYPGPNCLVPEEIELLASLDRRAGADIAELPDSLAQRLRHLRECPPCGALTRAARPDPLRHDEFLAAVRRSGSSPATPSRSPVVHLVAAVRRAIAARAARRERKRRASPVEVA